MASSRREHLIDTALGLFSRHGFHATGIDKILAEAGVAKMTLYKHFKSKDELILATLRRHDERFRNWFMRRVEARAKTPRDRLLALYDTLAEWFAGDAFTGCMFINASAEFGNPNDPVRAASVEHGRLILDFVRGIAAEAGARDPDALATQLALLMDGSIVFAYVGSEPAAVEAAKAAAEKLIDDAIDGAVN